MSNEVLHRDDELIDLLDKRLIEDFPEVEMPLTHLFTPGLYSRQIFMPAGTLVSSKIHKTQHPYIISKGKLLIKVFNAEVNNHSEWTLFEAPYFGVTHPGTKRYLYIIEDTIFTTFHATDKTTPEEVEADIIEPHENPFIKKIKNEN